MKYMGEIYINYVKKPCPMAMITSEIGLQTMTTFETQDVVGTMQWRGGDILVLVHLSWGNMNDVRKLKIWAHHVEETENSEFWKLITEKLKDIINADVQEKEKPYDYLIKYDGD